VEFEYDPHKSTANQVKHGIDFMAAQALWKDIDRLEIPARSRDEPRWQLLGRIGDAIWSAFFTYRDGTPGDRVVRIISVRRARAEEKEIYENG
jgi:uncharacterized DUF497 family protein